ncbi:MAG: DUF1566 domain-containing protein [Treponema succinifaciens]|nr:MAG: DUF1566 domain-containing protein [Treponema succinifaciens]
MMVWEEKVCHYLEMSKSTLGVSKWASSQDYINTFVEIGYGKSNTYKILNYYKNSGLSEENCAAYRCSIYSTEKTVAGEWFLPSKDELNEMYNTMSRTVISDATDNWFWSSSAYDSDDAWKQRFSAGSQFDLSKSNPSSVRAVRAF